MDARRRFLLRRFAPPIPLMRRFVPPIPHAYHSSSAEVMPPTPPPPPRGSSVACSCGTTRDGRIFYFPDVQHEQFHVALINGPHDEHKFYEDSRGSLVIPKGQSSFYSSMDFNNTTEERIVACRICHMNLEENVDDEQFDGIIVELGCNCKGELGAAHINCAETWFQIKGNTICEICGAIALNIGVEQEDEVNDAVDVGEAVFEASTEELSRDIKYGRIAMAALVALCFLSFLISYHLHIKHDH